MPNTDDSDDEGSLTMADFDFGDHVDIATFGQILDMDEVGHDFSNELADGFLRQADGTFMEIKGAIETRSLSNLSSLGHFLKGSSATLGFNKIRDSCQVIQQYGSHMNIDGSPEPDDTVCLDKIKAALQAAKTDKYELRRRLIKFFGVTDSSWGGEAGPSPDESDSEPKPKTS